MDFFRKSRKYHGRRRTDLWKSNSEGLLQCYQTYFGWWSNRKAKNADKKSLIQTTTMMEHASSKKDQMEADANRQPIIPRTVFLWQSFLLILTVTKASRTPSHNSQNRITVDCCIFSCFNIPIALLVILCHELSFLLSICNRPIASSFVACSGKLSHSSDVVNFNKTQMPCTLVIQFQMTKDAKMVSEQSIEVQLPVDRANRILQIRTQKRVRTYCCRRRRSPLTKRIRKYNATQTLSFRSFKP